MIAHRAQHPFPPAIGPFSKASLAAASKTSSTPVLVLAEVSKYPSAPIVFAMALAASVLTTVWQEAFHFSKPRLQKSRTNQSTMQLYVTLVFLCNIVNLTISFAARALIIVWSSLKSLLSPTKMICCNYNKFWDFGFWISCFGKLTNRSFLKCWIF